MSEYKSTPVGEILSSQQSAAPVDAAKAAELLDLLQPLGQAVGNIDAFAWAPDDDATRADMLRQAMMNLSYAYFAWFHATPEHPDWAPLWNPVFTLQPNPDDIYTYSPIRGDLVYRISGNRGTTRMLLFTSQRNMSGMVDNLTEIGCHMETDDRTLGLKLGEDFSVIFSAEKPAGYDGLWAPIHPEATAIFTRFRSCDWENEIDPRLSIECLSPVPPKPRLNPQEIRAKIDQMARMPARKTAGYFPLQNGVKDRVGFNVFEPVRMAGALAKQIYWPAVFQFDADEALIIETEVPHCSYWNVQLNDPYFNALEYVYRLSSTNDHYARLSSDGKFRAVISLNDPGVPNWLDPAGYTEGGIYGRWFEADAVPTPSLKRVKFADLREHLPADTPVVTPEQRGDELARRVRACQRRRRW